MSASKNTMIEFRDIHKYYGDYHALAGSPPPSARASLSRSSARRAVARPRFFAPSPVSEGIDSGAVLLDGKDMSNVPRTSGRRTWCSSLTPSSRI